MPESSQRTHVLDEALAERKSFTHAWLYDTQMICADVFQCLALCAAKTKKIKLGTNVNNPLSRIAPSFGTIMPAAWSFMLAARARGLGCCWTTVHLLNADKAARVLGLPATITQAVLLPVAHFVGETFRSAPRIPARKLTWWNKWGLRRN
jgi:nitroreductase